MSSMKRDLEIQRIVISEIKMAILEENILNEGIWDSLKNAFAKLGSLEKGGSMFGKSERSQKAREQAEDAASKLETKASAASKALVTRLRGDFVKSGYPNQKDKYEFLEQTYEIEALYDSLKKSVEDGKMDSSLANELIEELRILVKKFLDYDLADVYKHFNESEDPLNEEEISGKDKSSTTMKGLESDMFPAILAALGTAGILGNVFLNSDIFKNLTTQIVKTGGSPAQVVKQIKQKALQIGPQAGEGMTQMVSRLSGVPLDPNSTLDQFFQAAGKIGITPSNIEQIGTSLGADSGSYATAAKQAGSATLDKVFGTRPEFFLDKGAQATTQVFDTVMKNIPGTAAKTAVKTTTAGKIGALVAPYLGALGVSLVAAAAGVKALRVKGQKSSRAQVLNDLLQKLDFLNDNGGESGPKKPPILVDPTKKPKTTEIDPTEEPPPEPSPLEPPVREPEDDQRQITGPEDDQRQITGPEDDQRQITGPDDKPEKPYGFPLYNQGGVEDIVKKFFKDRKQKVSPRELEIFLGEIEDWLMNARKRGADYYDIQDRDFMNLAEKNSRVKSPNIPIKRNVARGSRGRSLDRFLMTYLKNASSAGRKQGGLGMFKKLNPKELAKLRKMIVKYVYDYLDKQGAPVQESEEDNLMLERWSRLAGITNKKVL